MLTESLNGILGFQVVFGMMYLFAITEEDGMGQVAELADAHASGACALIRRGGSSPLLPTRAEVAELADAQS